MKDMTCGYCERCEIVETVAYDDPQLRRWARRYMFIALPFIPLSPIIGADFAVMLPMTMIYLIGLGPAFGIVREPPKCEACGAAVELDAAPIPA